MTELILLGVFSGALLFCVLSRVNILAAMIFGYFLFFFYGIRKGYSLKQIGTASFQGIKTVRNILLIFLFIGAVTASWRSSGTIAFLVYHASAFCSPRVMVLACFLLCAFISFLTGTAFGTAATMGIICISMANGMGISPVLSGGAILAGVYFGDRCSPMSTSALLVSELTGTDIFRNIAVMVKTAFFPFLFSCIIYYLLGAAAPSGQAAVEVRRIFSESFVLHPAVVLPAALVLLFSAFRIPVRYTLSVSAILASLLSIIVQGMPAEEMLRSLVFGFLPDSPELKSLMSGGGILSMVRVFCIVCISSCYAGIFKTTGFLHSIHGHIRALSRKINAFAVVLLTSLATSSVSCNQTLSIMLTAQICEGITDSREEMASWLEDTAVVIAPLIPWSIAGGVPLASVGAPLSAIPFAVYLWILPLWNLILSLLIKKAGRTG